MTIEPVELAKALTQQLEFWEQETGRSTNS